MKAIVKENKAYCPICSKREYKVIGADLVQASTGNAIRYKVRCSCGEIFNYLCKQYVNGQDVFVEDGEENLKEIKENY